jgi:predicted protein tyrosine phosphatase
MTAVDIMVRLCRTTKGIAPARIVKAKMLAYRSRIEWTAVLAVMDPTHREAVQKAEASS